MSRSICQRSYTSILNLPSRSTGPTYCVRYSKDVACVRLHRGAQRSIRTSTTHKPSGLRTTLRHPGQRKQSSYTPYILLFALVTSTAVVVDYVTNPSPQESTLNTPQAVEKDETEEQQDPLQDDLTRLFAEMAVPQGSLGNLTPQQEQALKDLWAVTLRTFGVTDPKDPNGTSSTRPITPADPTTAPTTTTTTTDPPSAKKKEKHGLFHRKNKESVSGSSSPSTNSSDPDDKYGQEKALQEILAKTSPSDLRAAFWSMVKKDHPDALLLRFLRARKWDVQKALAMMVSTMHWRRSEQHVDDDVMRNGEAGALADSQSSDPAVAKEGKDFLMQLRLGKSFLHGVDKEGRPICFVRVRLHKGGDQSERSLERYTVYVIETCRLALQPPVETATIVFDMTSFTMANMDYTPVKFMIKVFEANYPESLGLVLVHKAPWIFQGIWKIIRGWLDPVVASKVQFTNGPEDLQTYIPRDRIITELGGEEKWEYKYVEPYPGENEAMGDGEGRRVLEGNRGEEVDAYERATFEWIHGGGEKVKGERDQLAQQLRENYWRLDPLIRARSLYDRTGMIGRDGTLNFYPSQSQSQSQAAGAGQVNGAGSTGAADDLD